MRAECKFLSSIKKKECNTYSFRDYEVDKEEPATKK